MLVQVRRSNYPWKIPVKYLDFSNFRDFNFLWSLLYTSDKSLQAYAWEGDEWKWFMKNFCDNMFLFLVWTLHILLLTTFLYVAGKSFWQFLVVSSEYLSTVYFKLNGFWTAKIPSSSSLKIIIIIINFFLVEYHLKVIWLSQFTTSFSSFYIFSESHYTNQYIIALHSIHKPLLKGFP